MANQFVDYTTAADTNDKVPASVKPVIDGEAAVAATFNRSTENLRMRTEVIRSELNDIKYASDADRATLITSDVKITWGGAADAPTPGTGKFEIGETSDPAVTRKITVRPFSAPKNSIKAKTLVSADPSQSVNAPYVLVEFDAAGPHAYGTVDANGRRILGNEYTVSFVQGAVFGVAVTGEPARHIVVTLENATTPISSLVPALNGNATWQALGLKATEVGAGLFTNLPITQQPIVGALDAERHVISYSDVVTFFNDAANILNEGDTVAIAYDSMFNGQGGGRREAVPDYGVPGSIEDNTPIAKSGQLVNLSANPEKAPLAIPLCTVQGDRLIFANGVEFTKNTPGVFSGATSGSVSYGGSSPNTWADNTGLAPGTVESALDDVVGALGVGAGASRIGFTPAGNLQGTSVSAALVELDLEKAGKATENAFTQANTFTVPSGSTKPAVKITGVDNNPGLVVLAPATAVDPAVSNPPAIKAISGGVGPGLYAMGPLGVEGYSTLAGGAGGYFMGPAAGGNGVIGRSIAGVGFAGVRGEAQTGGYGVFGIGSLAGVHGIGGFGLDSYGVYGQGKSDTTGANLVGGVGVHAKGGDSVDANDAVINDGGHGLKAVGGAGSSGGYGVFAVGGRNVSDDALIGGAGVRAMGSNYAPGTYSTGGDGTHVWPDSESSDVAGSPLSQEDFAVGAGVVGTGGFAQACGLVGYGGNAGTAPTITNTLAGVGVLGVGNAGGEGVIGFGGPTANQGVYGASATHGVQGRGGVYGVIGVTDDSVAGSAGVFGQSPNKVGVAGVGTEYGTGVYGQSSYGLAARFKKELITSGPSVEVEGPAGGGDVLRVINGDITFNADGQECGRVGVGMLITWVSFEIRKTPVFGTLVLTDSMPGNTNNAFEIRWEQTLNEWHVEITAKQLPSIRGPVFVRIYRRYNEGPFRYQVMPSSGDRNLPNAVELRIFDVNNGYSDDDPLHVNVAFVY